MEAESDPNALNIGLAFGSPPKMNRQVDGGGKEGEATTTLANGSKRFRNFCNVWNVMGMRDVMVEPVQAGKELAAE